MEECKKVDRPHYLAGIGNCTTRYREPSEGKRWIWELTLTAACQACFIDVLVFCSELGRLQEPQFSRLMKVETAHTSQDEDIKKLWAYLIASPKNGKGAGKGGGKDM